MLPEVKPADIREAAYGFTIPGGYEVDDKLQKLIAKAGTRIVGAYPTLLARLDAELIEPDTVAGVIEDMVLRVARNPNGYRQVSIDDYNRTIDTALSTGQLYISDQEADLLAPPSKRKARGTGTMRVSIPAWRLP